MSKADSFDFSAVEDFDDHITKSIPFLGQLDDLVCQIVNDVTQPNTRVVDLGCSEGRILNRIPKINATYLGVDNGIIPTTTNGWTYINKDICKYVLGMKTHSVVMSIFTLQFLPPNERLGMLIDIRDSLTEGGVFICAEKVHANTPRIENILQTELLRKKREHFTDTEIIDKQIALSPIMHCRTHSELQDELSIVGDLNPFWCWGNFIAYAVTKRV